MISGEVTADDYLAAHRLSRKEILMWLNIVTGIVAALGLALLLTATTMWGLLLLCGGLGGLAGEFVQSKFWLPRKVHRLHAQLKLAGPITYSWDDEILEAKSASGHYQRKWKDFVRLKQDNAVMLLYITDYLFEVVPKRWFRDAGQLEEFQRHASGVRGT